MILLSVSPRVSTAVTWSGGRADQLFSVHSRTPVLVINVDSHLETETAGAAAMSFGSVVFGARLSPRTFSLGPVKIVASRSRVFLCLLVLLLLGWH